MFRGKGSTKIAFIITLIFVGSVYTYLYISTINAGKYHKEFVNDRFDKVEIKVYNTFTDEVIKHKITDGTKIQSLYTIFTKLENHGQRKEAKLYDYSIWLKFYNIDRTNIYKFEVFFDEEKIELRPVALYKKGDTTNLDGYLFNLRDTDYEFYNIVMNILEK